MSFLRRTLMQLSQGKEETEDTCHELRDIFSLCLRSFLPLQCDDQCFEARGCHLSLISTTRQETNPSAEPNWGLTRCIPGNCTAVFWPRVLFHYVELHKEGCSRNPHVSLPTAAGPVQAPPFAVLPTCVCYILRNFGLYAVRVIFEVRIPSFSKSLRCANMPIT